VWAISFFAGVGCILSHLDTLGKWREHLSLVHGPGRHEE